MRSIPLGTSWYMNSYKRKRFQWETWTRFSLVPGWTIIRLHLAPNAARFFLTQSNLNCQSCVLLNLRWSFLIPANGVWYSPEWSDQHPTSCINAAESSTIGSAWSSFHQIEPMWWQVGHHWVLLKWCCHLQPPWLWAFVAWRGKAMTCTAVLNEF